jgi:hypothetical protein
MNTVTLQLNDIKALSLLKELEALKIVTLLNINLGNSDIDFKDNATKEMSLGKKYAGRISTKLGEEMNQYIQKSREEWAERTL